MAKSLAPPRGSPRSAVRCRLLYHERESQQRQRAVRYHAHPFWQIEVALTGGIEAQAGGTTWRMAAGDVLLIPAHVPHGFLYAGPDCRWVSVKAAVEGRPAARAARLSARRAALEGLCAALLAIARERGEPAAGEREALEGILAALVALEYPAHAAPEEKAPLAAEVRALLEREGGRALTVAEVARRLGYSVSHVSARFRREAGLALKSFLDRHRARMAARALEYSDLSIGEVAETLSFGDVFAFSRFFKRVMGRSPRLYRARRAVRRHRGASGRGRG